MTALGGRVSKGISRRAQLHPATESVLRNLLAPTTTATECSSITRRFHDDADVWSANFFPAEHYPRQPQHTQMPAAQQPAGGRHLGSQPLRCSKPADGERRCPECTKKRVSADVCCAQHHVIAANTVTPTTATPTRPRGGVSCHVRHGGQRAILRTGVTLH